MTDTYSTVRVGKTFVWHAAC